MTNDYKDELLKYLTGNINEESNQLIQGHFQEQNVVTNGLKTYLDGEFSSYIMIGVLQSENYDTCIIYGNYTDGSGNHGYFLITDKDFNPIQLITQYDSGNDIQMFYKLELDEKNQAYGIDYNSDTSKYRFVMFNNIFSNGVARLRQSYNTPNVIGDMSSYQLTKDFNSANYLIAGIVYQGNIYQPKVVKLTVNVGATNDWVTYDYSGTLLGAESSLSKIYADWSGTDVQFKITAFSQHQFLVYYSWYYNSQTLINVDLYDVGDNWTSVTIDSGDSIVADANTFYYGVCATVNSQKLMSLFMINNGVQSLIKQEILTSTSTLSERFILNMIKGTLMYIMLVPNNSKTDIVVGIYKKDVVNMSDYIAQQVQFNGYQIFDLINNFNLYKFNFQDSDKLYSIKLLYNSNIDFGTHTLGYGNDKDLKPLTMSLYENSEILFNRNLYNLVTSGSTTTATVEVPNTMLNTNTIDEENLIGNHYLQIANNTEEITTNEYETLHINTINTLSMINLDTSVLNPSGSARLNNSVNLTQDYENARCTKIRINYEDDTTKILNITFYPTRNYFYTKFALYIDKAISSIDFISQDENTVYNTINPTFTVGNIYTIKQNVRINDIIPSEPVLYDNIQVQYNGEDVIY